MKIKSYINFIIESIDTNRDIIIQFLISRERISNMSFDDFELVNDDNGEMLYIVAYTKEGEDGKKPPVDKVIFSKIDYQTWIIECKYRNDNTRISNEIHKMKGDILKQIVYTRKHKATVYSVGKTHSEHGTEPNDDKKKIINSIFNSTNVWAKAKDKSKNILSIIDKYNIEDIEDRSIEFMDELSEWEPLIMFAWYYDNGWHGLNVTDNINEITCRLIWDAWYQINSKKTEVRTIEDFLVVTKPCIYFNLNKISQQSKILSDVEEVADRMVARYKQLYNIDEVLLPYNRDTRQYNPSDIETSDYQITFILK